MNNAAMKDASDASGVCGGVDVSRSLDLYLVVLFTGLAYLFVLVPPFNQTVLRIPFALILLLFLPGYVLISAMFPRMGELSGIERFALSVGMSIAITVFDGFAISVTPWRFRPHSIIISLAAITLFLTFITLIVRVLTPREKRYGITVRMIREFFEPLRENVKMSDVERALLIALIGSIIIASGMLAYAKILYVLYKEERFTALYILGEEGKAEKYPKVLHLLEPTPIIVGVDNYEHAPTKYRLRIELSGYTLYEQDIALDHSEKWRKTVYIVPKHAGKHMKLLFLLYKGEDFSSPYRSVHLLVDSVIDYENLEKIKHFALSSPPDVANGDMETNANWTFETNTVFFRGFFTKFRTIPNENATVCGYVTDNETGMPIPNARVRVDNHYGYKKENLTDERGYYEIKLMQDHFWMSCEASGYDVKNVEFSAKGGEVLVLNISLTPVKVFNWTVKELEILNETIVNESAFPPNATPTVKVEEAPICSLRGYVVDNATGVGIANASVRITNNLGFSRHLMTDERGYFEATVVAGKTRISAIADGYRANSTTADLPPAGEASVEVRLDRKPSADAIVCGYIYDNSTGMPLPNAYVQVRNDAAEYHNYTTSNASGYYEMRVVSGHLRLDVRKEGYFTRSTTLNISRNDTVMISMRLDRIPPPATVTGYVTCKGVGIPHVSVVVRECGNDTVSGYERRAVTDERGYFEMDVMPGHLCLEVMPSVYGERIEFDVKGGERLRLDVPLKAFPNSTYLIIYPSHTRLVKGYYGGISQKLFAEREGVATLTFSVSDSFRSEWPAGCMFKQVLLNGIVVWEDDVAGDEGWQHVKIPVTFDAGENNLVLRLYAKKDAERFQMVSCWWDDVRVEPIFEYTKDKATTFRILDAEGGTKYPSELHLGESTDFIAEIENNERERMHYTLQVRLNGYILIQNEKTLEDGEMWRHKISITPNQLGSLLKLEFLLFASPANASTATLEKPYKSFCLWLPSTINRSNIDVLEKFVFSPMPRIENGDMEACCGCCCDGACASAMCGWSYAESDENFTGGFTNVTAVSPFCAYDIAYPATVTPAGGYAEISQKFHVRRDVLPANIVISFSVRDSCEEERAGVFRKQVILNDDVIWEDDVSGDEGWQHVKIPVTLYSSHNRLTLRVFCDSAVKDFPIHVWWDDVRIEPITAITEKMHTSFCILDAEGGTKYPSLLYLGKPVDFIAEIENNEGKAVDYILQTRFSGHLTSTHYIRVGNGEKVRCKISIVPDFVFNNKSIEFLLFKERVEERPYRYFKIDNVSCVIDYDDTDALLRYGMKKWHIPIINDGDMRSGSAWTFKRNGSFTGALSYDVFVSPPSYCVEHSGMSNEGEFGEISQHVTASSSGIVILSFNVRDDMSGEGDAIVKEVVLNGMVVWSDDVSGADTGYRGYVVEKYNRTEDRWNIESIPEVKAGWMLVDIPVYLHKGDNKIAFRLRTVKKSDESVRVFWDDVRLKAVDDVIKIGEDTRSRRYGL